MKNRIKVYWLLLLTLLYTASLVLSIGETQARFESTISGHTVVRSQETGVVSDCLITAEDAPLTVLVGELPLYKTTTVSFWLRSLGADASGKLAWGVADSDYEDYLKLSMLSGCDVIEPNAEILLLEDLPLELSLDIQPTELARTTAHGVLVINVLVTWGEEMWGTFQVTLPEVKEQVSEEPDDDQNGAEETVPQEEDLPENDLGPDEDEDELNGDENEPNGNEAEPNGNEAEPNGNEAEPNGDENEPNGNETEPNGDENEPNGDETEPNGDETEPNGDETEPNGDETEPNGDEDEPNGNETESNGNEDEPNVDESEPNGDEAEPDEDEDESNGDETEPNAGETDPDEEDPESDTDETEPVENTTESEEQEKLKPIRIETLPGFDPAEKLPVKIHLTDDITSIRLGLWNEQKEDDKKASDVKPFRSGTKFSLNGGESYYMMYNGYVAEFTFQEMTSLSLLLDFAETNLDKTQDLVLAMEAYSGDGLVYSCKKTVKPDVTIAPQSTTGQTMSNGQGWILTRGNTLEFGLPMQWQDAELEYLVEILTLVDSQRLEYREVELTEDGLFAKHRIEEEKHDLVFRLGKELPQAGTYRLTMKWTYKGICFAQTQRTFFINYSAHTQTTLSSMEVPKND